MKKCTKCHELKALDQYTRRKSTKDGRAPGCKTCYRVSTIAYRAVNVDKTRQRRLNYYANNKETLTAKSREYYAENKLEINNRKRKAYLESAEKLRKISRDYRVGREEELNNKKKVWSQNNRDKVRQYDRERHNKLKGDPLYQLRRAQRRLLSNFLQSINEAKNKRTNSALGYTQEQLKTRIELNFQPGMSWSNHGDWHIDHTIPVAYFISKGEQRPNIVNALCNLRPLWAKDNLSKGSSLPSWLLK